MSKLEKAIVAIVEVFEEYAGTDDNKTNLSNAELKTLIQNQLGSVGFKDKVDSEEVHKALENMDKNCDGQVNFKEFSHCVFHLAHGYFKNKYSKGKHT